MSDIKSNFFMLFIATLVLYSIFSGSGQNEVALAQQDQTVQSIDEEYYPNHPAGCGYVKKLVVESSSSYYFIESCSRDNRMWLQEITVVDTSIRGVIYVSGDSLINGVTLHSGYWCSLQAPGFENVGTIGKCTKDGWIPKTPQ